MYKCVVTLHVYNAPRLDELFSYLLNITLKTFELYYTQALHFTRFRTVLSKSCQNEFPVLILPIAVSVLLVTAVKRSKTSIRTRDWTYLPHCLLLQQLRMILKSDSYIKVSGELAAKQLIGFTIIPVFLLDMREHFLKPLQIWIDWLRRLVHNLL